MQRKFALHSTVQTVTNDAIAKLAQMVFYMVNCLFKVRQRYDRFRENRFRIGFSWPCEFASDQQTHVWFESFFACKIFGYCGRTFSPS